MVLKPIICLMSNITTRGIGKMKLTLLEVRNQFLMLLNDEISREEVDRWAYSIIRREEIGDIIFFPNEDRDKIFSAVMYLYGIDIQDKPGEYLHTKDDIVV